VNEKLASFKRPRWSKNDKGPPASRDAAGPWFGVCARRSELIGALSGCGLGTFRARESLGDLSKIVEEFPRLDLGGRYDEALNAVIREDVLPTGLPGLDIIGEAEEELNRLVSRQSDLMQTTGADAIGAVLILLDLLVRHTNHFAELLLAHLGDTTGEAHTLTDEAVDIGRATRGHNASSSG
jgi:hypothetical protein